MDIGQYSLMLSLTIRQLEYVAAVARHEGISSAAEMMNVSQPSISVALAQVEQHLGYKIFLRRNGAKLETTSKGRAFIAELQDVLHAFAVATEGRGRQKMPVHIGCFSDLAPMIMAPLLKKLAALHPEISVFFKLENFETLNDELKSGRIDFAVSYDLGFSEEFDRKQIASLRPHIVVGVSHALADAQNRKPKGIGE